MKRPPFLFSLVERLAHRAREWRIAWYGFRLLRARSREQQAVYWRRMAAEIGARSPAQVARMEAEKGLEPSVGMPRKQAGGRPAYKTHMEGR
jgi:hypothetical protein